MSSLRLHNRPSHSPDLLLALFFSSLPHAFRLPLWVSLATLFFWSWRFLVIRRGVPGPPPSLLRLLTLSVFLALLFSQPLSRIQISATSLLILMAGLKPFELNTRQDRFRMVFLADFIVISNLFFSNSLAMALYMAACVILNQAVLARLSDPDRSLFQSAVTTTGLAATAIPVALLFFLLFPRAHGQIWGLQRREISRSGFSETIRPGDVATLARSRDVAFRVTFDGRPPSANHLYFRGLIFRRLSDATWQADPATTRMTPSGPAGPPRFRYAVALEPTRTRRLFALDWPRAGSGAYRLAPGGVLAASIPLVKKVRYEMESSESAAHIEAPVFEERSLPESENPKMRALGERLSHGVPDPEVVMQRVLAWFRERPFRYTLNPPPTDVGDMDAFLFDTRAGYCEHFASATTQILRAAGIPSRMVGGYLGGEFNPVGGYFIIRQSEAHVWVEAWSGENWVRLDPTATVAPERIESGMRAALPESDIAEIGNLFEDGPLAGVLTPVRLFWDGANLFWSQQVLSFSRTRQESLLKKFGIDVKRLLGKLLAIIVCISGVVLVAGGYLLFSSRRPSPEPDRIQADYIRFCRLLETTGFPTSPTEGPLALAMRVSGSRPDLAPEATEILDTYIKARYAAGKNPERLRAEFHRLVADFRNTLRQKGRHAKGIRRS